MKIIHTADWHLGQSFYEYDRKAEHLRFLAWLKQITKKLSIDILLIAGDIFDSPNPSAESQKLYYTFLREITSENQQLQIIIIAGNHDSSARLEAPNPLLEIMNVTTKGVIRRTADEEMDLENLIVPLNAGGYCLTVPFMRQGDYPDTGSYSQSIKAMYDELYMLASDKLTGKNNLFAPIIAMGHLHAAGAEVSENDRSERNIIGGLESVSSEAFSPGIVYTALGHLHRSQEIPGSGNIRYSGAPIPMSFAEKNNKQGIILVEIDENRSNSIGSFNSKYDMKIEHIDFEDTIRLISIPEEPMPLDDVLREIGELPEGEITETSPYLEIKILLKEPEPSLSHIIEKALTGKSVRLARISASTNDNYRENKKIDLDELREANPITIAEEVFKKHFGGENMPEVMKKLLYEVIHEVGG